MTAKLIALMLIVFSLVGLAIPSGGLLQTVFAQSLEGADDDAEVELEEQEVENEVTTTEESSSDDNVIENDNEFGDDGVIVDQDNEADEDAANVGVQDQDLSQELDQEQDAANTNVDFDIQVGQQLPPPLTPPPPPPPPPPEEEGVWCYTSAGVESTTGQILVADVCFDTQSECEEFRAADPVAPLSECERFDEPPPGCEPSTIFAEANCVVIREA